MENKENINKEENKDFYPREEVCPCCGKKYICYSYSQTVCLDCLNDYADFIIKNSEED